MRSSISKAIGLPTLEEPISQDCHIVSVIESDCSAEEHMTLIMMV